MCCRTCIMSYDVLLICFYVYDYDIHKYEWCLYDYEVSLSIHTHIDALSFCLHLECKDLSKNIRNVWGIKSEVHAGVSLYEEDEWGGG